MTLSYSQFTTKVLAYGFILQSDQIFKKCIKSTKQLDFYGSVVFDSNSSPGCASVLGQWSLVPPCTSPATDRSTCCDIGFVLALLLHMTLILSAETAQFSGCFCSEDPTALSKPRITFTHSLLVSGGVRRGETEAQTQHPHFQQ